MASDGFKLHLRSRDDVITEPEAQVLGCSPVNRPSAGELRKLGLNAGELKQTRFLPGFELHQQVDVAIGPRCTF